MNFYIIEIFLFCVNYAGLGTCDDFSCFYFLRARVTGCTTMLILILFNYSDNLVHQMWDCLVTSDLVCAILVLPQIFSVSQS